MTTIGDAAGARPAPGGTRPCPRCGAEVDLSDEWTVWCDHCDWNVDGGQPPRAGAGQDPLARLRQRATDSAAARAFDALRRHPDDLSWGRGRTAAVALAATVLVVLWGGLAVLLGWALGEQGAARVVWVLVVVAAAALFLPRPSHVRDGELLDVADHPRLHALLGHLAAAMDSPTPAVVRLDTSYNMSVGEDGWRRTPVLVIGLPLWTVLSRDERLFVLGHELGHLRGLDARWGHLIWAARTSLANVVDLLWISTRTMDGSTLALFVVWLTSKVLRVVAWPFVGLLVLLDRLESASRQRAEYLADRRATLVAGSAAAEAGLAVLLGRPRGEVAASAAMRRDEDPWAALDAVPARPAREVERLVRLGRLTGHRSDASHPPSHLRLELVRAGGLREPSHAGVTGEDWDAVEAELRPWRSRLRRDYEDHLLELR